MKMRTLSKKTLAIFLSTAMLLSCMVWSGVSAEDINWNVFTCNFEGRMVKATAGSADETDPGKIAGYAPDGTAGSGDNTVLSGTGSALQVKGDTNGYMKVTKTAASSKNVGFRLFGNYGTWQTSINGTTVVSNSDMSRAVKNIRYRITLDYKVVAADVDANLDVSVLAGSVQTGYGTTGNVATKAITSADVSDEWVTWSATYVAPSDSAWLVGVNSAADGNVEVHFDNIVMEYMPDSRMVINNFALNDGTSTYVQEAAIAGDLMVLPEEPTRDGYAFLGWYDEAGVQYTAESVCPDTAITLTAQWAEAPTDDYNADAYKTYYATYADNNGTGYAKAPGGKRFGTMSGNGSGVILSYLHNYDAATGTDVPGTAADGGYSAAIHLSGDSNLHTSPKHVLKKAGNRYDVTRGHGYTVTFMVYVEEAMTLPLYLGSVPTGNLDLNTISQSTYKKEIPAQNVELPAATWTEVTLTVDALTGVDSYETLCLFLGTDDGDSGVYVYVDNVRIVEQTVAAATGMDFENLELNDSSLNLSSECSTTVSDEQNHTINGQKSLYIRGHWGGANRAQFLVTDNAGNPIRVENGADYVVSFWIMKSSYSSHILNWWLLASDQTSNWTQSADKNARLLTYGTDGATTEWSYVPLGDAFEWVQIRVLLEDVALQETSEDNYLRIGIGPSAQGTHTFYVDDIVVEKLSGNPDGVQSFENVASGTDVDVRDNSNHTATITNAVSHTGANAIMVTNKGSRTGNVRSQIVLTDDADANVHVQPGATYRITMWMMVPDGAYAPNIDLWIAALPEGSTSFTDSTVKDTYKYTEPGASLGVTDQWVKVTLDKVVTNANITADMDLVLGVCITPDGGNGNYNSGTATFYIDDISFVQLDGDNATLGSDLSAWMQVDGDAKYGTTSESLVFQVDDGNGGTVEKSFVRMGAKYTTDAADLSTVVMGGNAYTIKQRGLLLGGKDAALSVSYSSEEGKYVASEGTIGMTSATDMDAGYWHYDESTKQVTYTVSVTFTANNKDTALALRSYMIVSLNGKDYVWYSDTVQTVDGNDLSGQNIYEAACSLNGKTYGWFTAE